MTRVPIDACCSSFVAGGTAVPEGVLPAVEVPPERAPLLAALVGRLG